MLAWIPWIRRLNDPKRLGHWERLAKYQFKDQLDCLRWLHHHYPMDVGSNTECIALPDRERPVHRPLSQEG